MILGQTFLEVPPPLAVKTTSCQLTFSLADVLFEDALGPNDNIGESSNLNSSIDFLITLIPEFPRDFGIELKHRSISGNDRIEGGFELPLMEGGFFIVVTISELLDDFAVICLCYAHEIRLFLIIWIEF